MEIKFTPRELEAVDDVSKALKELNNALRIASAKSIYFGFAINGSESDRFDQIECTRSYIQRDINNVEWEEAIKTNKAKQDETQPGN